MINIRTSHIRCAECIYKVRHDAAQPISNEGCLGEGSSGAPNATICTSVSLSKSGAEAKKNLNDMHSDSDSVDSGETRSEIEPSLNEVIKFDSTRVSSHRSTSSSVSISDETYTSRLNERVRELKSDISSQCRLDRLEMFEPSEHSPKVELNLLLTPTNGEPTIEQSSLSKRSSSGGNERMQGTLSRVMRYLS